MKSQCLLFTTLTTLHAHDHDANASTVMQEKKEGVGYDNDYDTVLLGVNGTQRQEARLVVCRVWIRQCCMINHWS